MKNEEKELMKEKEELNNMEKNMKFIQNNLENFYNIIRDSIDSDSEKKKINNIIDEQNDMFLYNFKNIDNNKDLLNKKIKKLSDDDKKT